MQELGHLNLHGLFPAENMNCCSVLFSHQIVHLTIKSCHDPHEKVSHLKWYLAEEGLVFYFSQFSRWSHVLVLWPPLKCMNWWLVTTGSKHPTLPVLLQPNHMVCITPAGPSLALEDARLRCHNFHLNYPRLSPLDWAQTASSDQIHHLSWLQSVLSIEEMGQA